MRRYLIVVLWLSFSIIGFSQAGKIKMNQKEGTLSEVIVHLESNYAYLFSYEEEAIQNIRVQIPKDKLAIRSFLEQVLLDTDLHFEIVQENYIILSRKMLSSTALANRQKAKEASLSIICGQLVDQLTEAPLAYANIYIQNTQKGSSTSADGRFEFKTTLQKGDSIVFSYVGYQEKTFLASDCLRPNCPTIALGYLEYGDAFVVVTDYLTDGIRLKNHGASTELNPQKIGALPGQVEPDVLTTIQFLPGISSADGSLSSIHVRGGTPDQNLILWEDMPIYHTAHYFGMISAFNPYIMDEVSVYRGGFDAEYGGRISSVIDLKSNMNATETSTIGLGANFVNAYANAKIPFAKNKASLIYSIRRSFAELGRTPAFHSITERIHKGVLIEDLPSSEIPEHIKISNTFKFLDTNLKVAYQLTESDAVSVACFYTNNDFDAKVDDRLVNRLQTDTLFLESKGISMAWNHDWSTRLSSKLAMLSTQYDYRYGYGEQIMNQNGSDFGLKRSAINEQQAHLLNRYSFLKGHEIKLGYQFTAYDIDYQITDGLVNDRRVDKKEKKDATLHVVHANVSSTKQADLGIDAGLRWSSFLKRNYIEPRVRCWYQPSSELTISTHVGRYYQFLTQLIEFKGDRASIDTPVWVLAGGAGAPILKSDQLQLGLVYTKQTWLLEIQGYYKSIKGLSSLATGFDENIGDEIYLGDAKVRGLDVLIKKRWNNYRTWLSYSYSDIEHEFRSFFDQSFSAPNERPHIFHWVNQYQSNHWQFSLGWKLVSGNPYSTIDNFAIRWSMNNQQGMPPREILEPIIPEFNSERLPFQHQLDASIAYTFHPKTDGDWKGVFGLSLFNIYNQNNIYKRSLFIDKISEPSSLKYSDNVDLGFTPNVVVRFEW